MPDAADIQGLLDIISLLLLLLLLTHLGRVVPQISKAVSSIYAVGPAQSTRVWQHQSDEEGVIPARDVLSIAH